MTTLEDCINQVEEDVARLREESKQDLERLKAFINNASPATNMSIEASQDAFTQGTFLLGCAATTVLGASNARKYAAANPKRLFDVVVEMLTNVKTQDDASRYLNNFVEEVLQYTLRL